jgi:hypothetical protein
MVDRYVYDPAAGRMVERPPDKNILQWLQSIIQGENPAGRAALENAGNLGRALVRNDPSPGMLDPLLENPLMNPSATPISAAGPLPPLGAPPPEPITPVPAPSLLPTAPLAGSAFTPPARDTWASDLGGIPGGGVPGSGVTGAGGATTTDLPGKTVGEELYSNPVLALHGGFQQAGVNSFQNPYAERAINRYAPILPHLMDFFSIAMGADPNDAAQMEKWVPQFIQQFMSGAINPQQLIRQALEMAHGNPMLEEFLLGLGPQKVLEIQGRTGGYGDRVNAARNRVMEERILRSQMAMQGQPNQASEKAWLDIIRGNPGVR